MKTLNLIQLESLAGGIIAPAPGEAEQCMAMNIAAFAMDNSGLNGMSPSDFMCYF